MPVLFNLSSWGSFPKAKGKDDTAHIARSLVNELNSKYGVSKTLGQAWLEAQKLLLLLDALDEVAATQQGDCLSAVNQFLESDQAPTERVVCCREEEYNQLVDAAADRLHLNGVICLKPLNAEQVQDYLIQLDCADLWEATNHDPQWTRLVQTPLWLSVSVLARNELNLEQWSQEASLYKRREQLLDAYVRQMLHSVPVKSITYADKELKESTVQQTRYWLVWIAKRLQEESQDEFLIEHMQPWWMLKTRWQKSQYPLIFGLVI
ncbi:MAG: hypothetical protein AAGB19_19040, partial [Cyanobacteria bacterium P01_F01_bin.3]